MGEKTFLVHSYKLITFDYKRNKSAAQAGSAVCKTAIGFARSANHVIFESNN